MSLKEPEVFVALST